MKLKKKFIEHCKNAKLEINSNQIKTINNLEEFKNNNFNYSFLNIFFKDDLKLGFYLHGDVGVGKTMILDFFFKELNQKKTKVHFNEFMINFHDYMFKNKKKDKAIESFVNELKYKTKLLFFDEFQVTNIVDAMILGKLFEKIFEKKICVLFSSNIKIDNLYEDGLQRDQFLPFLNILKKNSYEIQLSINEDYRVNRKNIINRFLSPINETNNFKLNKFFRELTKNKKNKLKKLNIKGRDFLINDFYEGIAKFKFDELCNKNLGAEDYIEISNCCNFILIEELPNFNDDNSNQQQRFITLIDVIYEKKIPILISSANKLNNLNSSKSLSKIFKRTISRLHELTSININNV